MHVYTHNTNIHAHSHTHTHTQTPQKWCGNLFCCGWPSSNASPIHAKREWPALPALRCYWSKLFTCYTSLCSTWPHFKIVPIQISSFVVWTVGLVYCKMNCTNIVKSRQPCSRASPHLPSRFITRPTSVVLCCSYRKWCILSTGITMKAWTQSYLCIAGWCEWAPPSGKLPTTENFLVYAHSICTCHMCTMCLLVFT